MLPNRRILLSSARFTPAKVLGLVGWYDPTRPDYVVLNGAGVANLRDRSGFGHDLLQATALNQPTIQPASLNGLATVLFDGAAHFLKTAAFTLNQPEFIVIVFNQLASVSGDRVFSGFLANSGDLRQGNTTGLLTVFAGSSVANNTHLGLNSFAIVRVGINGAFSFITVNKLASTTGDPGVANAGGFTLGANGSGIGPSNIQVAQVLIYNRIPSAAEQDYLVAGLAKQFGLAI